MASLIKNAVKQTQQATDTFCLHELFESQVDQRPSQVALVCGGRSWTYEKLDQHTNQLARYLREYGVGPGTLVGLYFDRSEMPIVAILAILKAGGGYVPIDPVHPADRARHILSEAQISVLLTEHDLADKASSFFDELIIPIDECADAIAEESTDRLSREETGVAPNDLCYVLYTSGTTGRPKGVMTEHSNVVQFIDSFNEATQLEHTDRVFQGFSLGFDGSVEEMWMAFSNGATLVVGTSDVVKFGDEVARLFDEQRVTVFSTVPTFLSMITKDLSTVRLIIVSGEPCPPDLVKKWARPGRRMLNVYGPTETTVNTTVAECSPEKLVTIGRPLRGYQVYLLDEHMEPVEPGTPGELYIGGVGVARGYFNQPELTDRQFVPSPFHSNGSSQRLYRTGDLVSQTDDGELHFHRRIDRQVKIRGFRIELSEIESVLREHPQIHQAVVNVFEREEGLKEIAAFVVPHDGSNGFDRDDVLGLLRRRLPPYMVPGYLDLIESMPTLASGKADRSRLPKPATPLVSSSREVVKPYNRTEQAILDVWQKVFKVSPISCEDDFFLDLGGYSLLAAQMVSQLRSDHNLEVAIRDVYQHATVRKLAQHVSAAEKELPNAGVNAAQPRRRSSREVFESLSRFTRWTCASLQAVLLCLFYGVITLPLLVIVALTVGTVEGFFSPTALVIGLIVVVFSTFPLSVLLSASAKWLVIGRFKPGEYPVWGWYYLRWWLVTRVQAITGISRYCGTPMMSMYFRMMGAKVGKNCIIDTPLCAAFDLVNIGDDSSIGAETQILGYRVQNGMLIIGRIDIGSRCFVGTHCALGINSKMEDDSYLDDMSFLPDGAVMKSGEARQGSPAVPADVQLPEVSEHVLTRRRPLLWGMLFYLASEIVGELMLVNLVPPVLISWAAYAYLGPLWSIASIFVALPISILMFCFIVAGIKTLILRRTIPGTYPVESWYFLRKWATDMLMSDSTALASMIFTTIYLPPWLRLLGAKIGKRAEISSVTLITPDLVEVGDESFFADGAMIGGRRYFRGHVQFEFNRVGSRTFVGNSGLLPVGADLGDNCLVGVLSASPGGVGARIPDNTEWLGSPAFRLPHRPKVGGFDQSETYRPTFRLYMLRCLIDALRIVMTTFVAGAGLAAYVVVTAIALLHLPLWWAVAINPLIASGVVFGISLSVIALKDLLMGRFTPVVKPLWSVYVWFNEVLNGVHDGVVSPLLTPALGTPMINWYLRGLGSKIGKRVFMETPLFSEFDLVEIGDYAALNMGVIVQNHLFEDRIMKSSHLKVGEGCSIGNMSIVLYDTEMEAGSSIDSLSLLMKGETLPAHTHWIGIPTSQVRASATN